MNRLLLIVLLGTAACAPRASVIPTPVPSIEPGDTKAVEWAQSSISYFYDYEPEDNYRPCGRTLALGFGDCDDYAQCAKEMTADWDCEEMRLVRLEDDGGGWRKAPHVVFFLRCDKYGIYGFFDNGLFVKGRPRWTF